MPPSRHSVKPLSCAKSCGFHSPISASAGPRPSTRRVTRIDSGPYGVMQAATSASTPNNVQRSMTETRCAGCATINASSATGAIRKMPKVKLPCRLAHNVMSGSSANDGRRLSSSARTSPATHSTITGSASACGRATMCGDASTKAAVTSTRAGVSARRAIRKYVSRPKVAAMAAPATATMPLQPASA